MKFLVTGSAGLVGSQVVKDLSKHTDEIYSCYNNAKPAFGTPIKMDLSNPQNMTDVIEKVKPDFIMHIAAMTNIDQCEIEKDLAMKINAKATEIISKQAARQNAFLLYVSTDYVFDGQHSMKKESDTPNPIDFYGKTKLEGEKAVMNSASPWCIARTSTPFGIHPSKYNFPTWVAKNLSEKKEIRIVTDQHTSPTYVPNLSRMLIELTKRQVSGIIHVAGATRISRYDMAELVADKLSLDKTFLKPASINDMSWKAKRPKDSSLDVSMATSILKEKPLTIEQSLDYFIQELKIR